MKIIFYENLGLYHPMRFKLFSLPTVYNADFIWILRNKIYKYFIYLKILFLFSNILL